MLLSIGPRSALALGVLLLLPWTSEGCGARSGIRTAPDPDAGDASIVGKACQLDADCATDDPCHPLLCREERCVLDAPVDCDDGDECTEDSCSPTGACENRLLALDEDRDGFKGPRPGFAPGSPGSCGDDCDDTSPDAHPGGVEICDGTDNDCNGIVDDGMHYEPIPGGPVLVSSGGHEQAGRGGLSHDGDDYAATYTAQKASWRNYFKGLRADGSTAVEETPITNVAGDAFTGPLVWTGAVFGTAWSDRRQDDNYEIWFNRLDRSGRKLGPDVRISDAPGFSLHPALLWNGSEFLLVWDDARDDQKAVYGQRIGAGGALLGDNLRLTDLELNAESPAMAEGVSSLAIAFNMPVGLSGSSVGLRIYAADFGSPGELVTLSLDDAVAPSIVFSRDRYVVAWEKKTALPGDGIWGATVSEAGAVLQSERRITAPSQFARTQALLPLGDRLLVAWAEYTGSTYDLFGKMLSASLEELSPAQPIAVTSGDSLGPVLAFGLGGDVGVLFDDTAGGDWQTYFARLECRGRP